VAETLRESLSQLQIDFEGKKLNVTASFGVTGWDGIVPTEASVDAMVARCDVCVYDSKANGRNRVSSQTM
jgi:PleD family two-component response regulator